MFDKMVLCYQFYHTLFTVQRTHNTHATQLTLAGHICLSAVRFFHTEKDTTKVFTLYRLSHSLCDDIENEQRLLLSNTGKRFSNLSTDIPASR